MRLITPHAHQTWKFLRKYVGSVQVSTPHPSHNVSSLQSGDGGWSWAGPSGGRYPSGFQDVREAGCHLRGGEEPWSSCHVCYVWGNCSARRPGVCRNGPS